MKLMVEYKNEEVKIPPKIRKELENAVLERARARALETEAKEMSSGANTTILPILHYFDIKKCEIKGVGRVSSRISRGRNINEEKLREALALEGLSGPKINSIIRKSAKSWEKEYVDFRL